MTLARLPWRRPRDRGGDRDRDLARTPKFGPLLLHGLGAAILAVAGAVGLYLFLAWLLGVPNHLPGATGGQPNLPIADQQKLLADLVKIALGLAAGIGAAFALVVGYRRARTEEASSHRDDRRLFSSRYQDAADLIGHDKAAVRLAGIYAMARLADDWTEQRQQCIDVLCAYLRLPYEPDPDTGDLGEREVRYSVIGLIRSHLRPDANPTWKGRNFDFNGAVFDGGDFRRAEFAGDTVDFRGAKFTGGGVDFRGAKFTGGIVNFGHAEFSGGTVDFRDAHFAGGIVDFGLAAFSGGTVDFSGVVSSGRVSFRRAVFSSGRVKFVRADFSRGEVYFDGVVFSGGAINFGGSVFSGGEVDFSGSEFSGSGVDFSGSEFSGSRVAFSQSVFSDGTVHFTEAVFSGGRVDFDRAVFSGGTVDFGLAEFADGTVSFMNARFSGGEVDLSTADLYVGGSAPQGLPEAPIAGLKLAGWMKQTSPDERPPH
ncbi:pentapeptide repeat-containing protein [Kribbella sp. NBC_00709]|uniref:pentapeptide repeat-containing protein n=1 Tax=Kribbella sp. NBC_00709 TaxID=2975972 RepID=UPI002E2C6BA7|nr:pentapeptide repeat-containing protein [Kribbella sp. NBC_00709]